MVIRRDAQEAIRTGARFFPVVAILGPRQSGKTTVARLIFKEHSYVSLEDLDMRLAAKTDPRSFLASRMQAGMIIDEFQYVPELLSYIQTLVDEEKKPGTFILTGSQNFLMNNAISQSLAGRISLHTLLPLSIHELSIAALLPERLELFLQQGSYPALYSQHIDPELLYKNYIQTYVERDVRDLTQVGDLHTFTLFISLCAARIGQLVNISSLANECGISDATARRWLSILQASYIIFLLQPYHANFGKRFIKTPKLYFYDTGLACQLLKIKPDELILHPYRGNVFESLIIADLLKWHYNKGKVPTLYFWKDKTGNEIDCIIAQGQRLIPVEVKSGRTVGQRFFEGLSYWQQLTQDKEGFVVFGGESEQARAFAPVVSWRDMSRITDLI